MSRRTCLAGLAAAASTAGLSAMPAAAQDKPAPSLTPTILPPDPNTKTPTYKAPAGAVDTHTHIFGPNAKYPYSPKRSYTPHDAPLEAFREVHTKIGITRAVIVNATVHGKDNQVILDAIAQSKGAYKGIANVDETFTDAQLL
ncbi:MAG: 2-pyrone-4,6-dicarboxylate hydrolase, partial [Azorhizobium sp. 35-67-5]